MTRTVRWGIIGCGAVTERKSGPAFQQIDGSALIAVMRRDGAKARDYAQRHGVAKWTDDADEILHDPDVDAIYVATPPGSHAEYVIRAATAGKPVYVDKPMARRYTECLDMIAACERAGVPLFVAYYRRALPAFLKVKELVDSRAIGRVRSVSVELAYPPYPQDFERDNPPWRVRPEISGGGYFFDLACHQLDFLDFVFGPIVSASGEATNHAGLYEPEDLVCASFRFTSGVLGTGTWCFAAPEQQRTDRTVITGDGGTITFPTFDALPITLHTPDGAEEFHFPKPTPIQRPLIQTVVDELLGRGTCPSTGVTGARTSRVMDEIIGVTATD